MEGSSKAGTTLAQKLFRVFLALALAVSFVPSLKTTASAAQTQSATAVQTQQQAAANTAQGVNTAQATEIAGGQTITQGGTYNIAAGSTGTIKFGADNIEVTLVGKGATETFNDLSIVLTPGSKLTLQDVYVSFGTSASAPFVTCANGSTVILSGTNQADYQPNEGSTWGTSKAVFEVAKGNTATFTGSGTMYGYKTTAGAYIGGSGGEANGTVNIQGGSWFLKSSKTGCIIGSDSTAEAGDPINISGGELYLKAVAKGALIGASKQGKSGDVNISGGLLELFEDFSGPAIGAGTTGNEGKVTVTGGSVKTVRSANSYSQKGETGSFHVPAVLWKSAVTATNDYALLPIDVSQYANNGSVTVKVDGKEFYSGSTYKYVTNEVKNPAEFTDGSVTKNATQANWLDNNSKWLVTEADYGTAAYPTKNGSSFVPENNLYLPLSKGDHTITIGNNEIKYYYDEATGLFANYDWYSTSATKQAKVEGAADLTISTPEELVAFKNIVNGTATAAGFAQDSFEGKTVKLGDDIDMASATNWVSIGNATNQFKGTFNGNSKTINGITATGTEGYMGLFGYNAGTIQNLNISQFCTFTSTTTGDYVGAVAAYNAGTIKGVTSAATVKADSAYNVGGIAGFNDGGKIQIGSSQDKAVSHGQGAIFGCSTSGAVTGGSKVGGIVGENAGAIRACSSSATVDGTNSSSKNGVGGIAGRNGNNYTAYEEPTIDSCYFTGTVGRASQKWIGGIAGFNSEKSAITNCYMAGTLVTGGGYYNAIAGKQEGESLCSNNYALSTIISSGDSESNPSKAEVGIKKTADELKAAAMITSLNVNGTVYAQDSSASPVNNGYPVFASGLNAYVVNFETNGADFALTPQIVLAGAKATEPVEPTLADAEFKGWYSDDSFQTEFKFDTAISADTIVYAKVECSVQYVTNGAKETIADQTVNAGTVLTAPTVTKDNSVFAGWFADSEFKEAFDFTKPITTNTTIYAKWVDSTAQFDVTFKCDEGATNVPDTQKITAGGKATKPATDPAKTGYTFDKWYKDEAYTTEFDFANEKIFEATTIYGKFTANEYTVTYYDGAEVLDLTPATYTFGQGITETNMPKAEKPGYTFDGWYDSATFDKQVTSIATDATGDVKLYAKFTANEYDIKYFDGANVLELTPAKYTYGVGVPEASMPSAVEKTGYVFAGWYDSATFTNQVTSIAADKTGEVSLYAKYVDASAKFKVTFNCGEGATNVPAVQEVQAGGKATKPETDPTKTGYTLAGWYTDKDCTEGNEFDFDKDTITEETTLYAKWVAAEYSITYYDGTKVLNLAPDKYIYGEGIAEDKMPKAEKTGYTFDGWYDSATFDKQVTSIAKDATGDVKLYAKFTATEKVTRLAGDDAAQTSAKISEQAFPEGAETVVLCKDDDFKDAMSATGLAGVLDAPILLTSATELSAATKTEIERLKATNVIIIGGTGAIKAEVETAAKTAVGESGTVERIFGNEAEETSVKCAERLATEKTKRIEAGETSEDFSKAIVSMSDNFQDALSMSSFAYTYHIPILLESSGATAADRSLTADAVTMLKTGSFKDAKVFVPGGTGAVSKASVEDVVGESRCTRLTEGESGYDTSNYIANWLTTNGDKEGETYMHAATTVIATGAEATKGVDALAGAALAGKSASPILLVNTNATLESKNLHTINGFFFDSRADIAKTYVLGGTAVVDTSLEARLGRLLG